MVIFLLFCGVPQKIVASVTNYTSDGSGTSEIGLRTQMAILRGKGRRRGERRR